MFSILSPDFLDVDPSFISLSTFIFSKAFFSLQSRRLHLALLSPSQTGALGCLLTGQRLTALEGAPGCVWGLWTESFTLGGLGRPQLGNLGSRIFRSLPWGGHVPRALFSSVLWKTGLWEPSGPGREGASMRRATGA